MSESKTTPQGGEGEVLHTKEEGAKHLAGFVAMQGDVTTGVAGGTHSAHVLNTSPGM